VYIGTLMPTCRILRCRYLRIKPSKLFRNLFTSLHGVISESDRNFMLVSCMYVLFLHEIEVCLNCNRLKRSGNYVTREGCLTVHLLHGTMWNANLMQLGNFIDVSLARHVSGTYVHQQEL